MNTALVDACCLSRERRASIQKLEVDDRLLPIEWLALPPLVTLAAIAAAARMDLVQEGETDATAAVAAGEDERRV